MKIYNANIYTMTGEPMVGWVEFNEKITRVEYGTCYTVDPGDIDAQGGILLPGFIDSHTHLGLCESGLGFEGDDCNEETAPFAPNLRVIDGINQRDKYFNMARRQGITTVAVAPGSASPCGGEIAVIKTMGNRIDDMLVKIAGIKFALGENPKWVYSERHETPRTRMASAAIIREGLFKAKEYLEKLDKYDEDPENPDSNDSKPDYDAACEAVLPLLRREISAHFHAHRADDIFTAIRIAKEFNLKLTLVHATDGYIIADALKDENITAITGPLLCDCSKPELVNEDIRNTAILAENSIKTAICTDHPETPIQYLALTAAAAIKGGLSVNGALRALTIHPAEILGLEDRIGKIAEGFDADLQLYTPKYKTSTLFSIFAQPIAVFIDGKEVNNA